MSAPNVLFIAVDSLRADAAYEEHVPTACFEALGHRGTLFEQCVSTTTSTTPSFSSILTGCYPPKHGVRGLQGYRLSPALVTMQEVFAGAGYETHAEVTGPLIQETGLLRGFADARHRPGYKVEPFNWCNDLIGRIAAYEPPWFTLLHTWEVHRPYRPAPDRIKRWDKPAYEAMVAETDRHLAPIIDAAGANTIVVLTGDHGEEYADTRLKQKVHRAARRSRKRFALGKWFPYLDKKFAAMALGHGFALWEHLVRVPLIIAGQGIPQARIAEQVRHVDLFPTLADLCGLEAPAGVDGRSVRTLMEGGALPEEPAYMEAVGVKLEGDRIEGARTADWKLLRRGDGRTALYRLNGGFRPDEKHNLAGRNPEVANILESFIEKVKASEVVSESGLTAAEEAVVEQQLRDLGYL